MHPLPKSGSERATFPRCGDCGREIVPLANSGPICFRVGKQPPQTIPASQAAQILRFLWAHRHHAVEWHQMYQAMGSHEVTRCLSTLRKRWHVPILCELIRKKTEPGKIGLCSIGSDVKVWEPENEGSSSNAN